MQSTVLDIQHPHSVLAPLRLFSLAGLGIDPDRFVECMAPGFHLLPEDGYALRQKQINYLLEALPSHNSRLHEFMPGFYTGERALSEINHLLGLLSPQQRDAFDAIQVDRRRAISFFELDWEDNWAVRRLEKESYQQTVQGSDLRSLKRTFQPMSDLITGHSLFKAFLRGVADMVHEVRPEVRRLAVTCHQMFTIARQGQAGSNAPEGMHQDGADYIVSAMVVERRHVTGGQSLIYGPDKETCYLSHTLQPGWGVFQADAGSPLWHNVTPVVLDPNSGEEIGYRAIFGFDIDVVETV